MVAAQILRIPLQCFQVIVLRTVGMMLVLLQMGTVEAPEGWIQVIE